MYSNILVLAVHCIKALKVVFFVFVEFEKHYVPEDMVRFGYLALPGLASIPRSYCIPEEDFELIEPCTTTPSSSKVQHGSGMTTAQWNAANSLSNGRPSHRLTLPCSSLQVTVRQS
jgi:hypothetical protein